MTQPILLDLSELAGEATPKPKPARVPNVSNRPALTRQAVPSELSYTRIAPDGHGALESVALYHREIAEVPLLSHDEEVALAKRIEAGGPDGRRAREAFIAANLRLVAAVARQMAPSASAALAKRGDTLDYADLVAEGNFGLMRAVDRFDWRRGFKFSTYATWWIRQSVGRALDNGRAIRRPVHLTYLRNHVARLLAEAREAGRPTPTADELAAACGVGVRRVRDALAHIPAVVSLNVPLDPSEPDSPEFGDVLPDTTTEGQLTHVDLTDEAARLLACLVPRERLVLVGRFGLFGTPERTLDEIGRQIGVTRERVRQIETGALTKLRLRARALPGAEEAVPRMPRFRG